MFRFWFPKMLSLLRADYEQSGVEYSKEIGWFLLHNQGGLKG